MKLAILYQQSEPPAKDGTKELVKIKEDCVAASQALKIKGLVRIDCREDKNGVFKIFDFNAKPNITGGVRRIKKALSLTLNAAASFVKPFLSHATAAIMSLGWFVSKSMHQKISFFMLLILYIKRIPIFNPLYAQPHDSKRYAPFLSHACL